MFMAHINIIRNCSLIKFIQTDENGLIIIIFWTFSPLYCDIDWFTTYNLIPKIIDRE